MILVIRLAPLCSQFSISKKLEQDLKPKEAKPSVVNQQCVVYHFFCMNKKIRQSASIFMKRTVGAI